MKNWETLKQRYLRDELSIRLGGLSANLARIKTLTGKVISQNTIEYLIRESKFFIEWTALDTDIDTTVKLVELQIQLASSQLNTKAFFLSLRFCPCAPCATV
jgi:hypothetical protein